MKIKDLTFAAKEFGKMVSEPFYSLKNSPRDIVRYYSGPVIRNIIIMSVAEVVSLATTGKPIDLTSKLSPIAQYVLFPLEGLFEGAAATAYESFKDRKEKQLDSLSIGTK